MLETTTIIDQKLTLCLVWQYAGDLETNSPRFTNPGDFFVYIVFVGSFIVVSRFRSSPSSTSAQPLYQLLLDISMTLHRALETSQICPPSHHLAAAVPGDEEDCPPMSCGSIIRNQSKTALYAMGAWWERHRESLCDLHAVACGGFGSLQAASPASGRYRALSLRTFSSSIRKLGLSLTTFCSLSQDKYLDQSFSRMVSLP